MARVRGFGELEASTMDRLWDRDSDATVRDTFADLSTEELADKFRLAWSV